MGIDVSHSLLVGASYDELEDWLENKVGEYAEDIDTQDIIEEYFETASPYYDSPLDDQFLGFRIPNFQAVNEDWWEVVKETAHQFELLTGVKASIRGGAHVW
jgi:hypothetical protein